MEDRKFVRVVDDRQSANARAYYVEQARRLLLEAGFIEQPDGNWLPRDEVPRASPS